MDPIPYRISYHGDMCDIPTVVPSCSVIATQLFQTYYFPTLLGDFRPATAAAVTEMVGHSSPGRENRSFSYM